MIFTQKEVDDFCELVQDTNRIHRSDVGIVPGLMVTSIITKNPEPGIMLGDLKVRYLNPLYVNQEFELVIASKKEKLGKIFVEYEIKTDNCVIQKIHSTLVRIPKN